MPHMQGSGGDTWGGALFLQYVSAVKLVGCMFRGNKVLPSYKLVCSLTQDMSTNLGD